MVTVPAISLRIVMSLILGGIVRSSWGSATAAGYRVCRATSFGSREAGTDNRPATAEAVVQCRGSLPPTMMINAQMEVDEVLESPRFLIGTVAAIVE